MKIFFVFLVLCFLGGLFVVPAQPGGEGRLRWYLAGLCLTVAVGFYVFHKLR